MRYLSFISYTLSALGEVEYSLGDPFQYVASYHYVMFSSIYILYHDQCFKVNHYLKVHNKAVLSQGNSAMPQLLFLV